MPTSTTRVPRRGTGVIIAVVLLALLCLNAWMQVFRSLVAWDDNPPLLIAWQALSGAAALTAAVGAWRLRRWAPAATVLYGLVTGTMISMLEPMLDLGAEARPGLLTGGLVVMCGSLMLAWVVGRSGRAHGTSQAAERTTNSA